LAGNPRVTIFLPDSSVLIDTLKNKQDRVSMLRSLVAAGHSLALLRHYGR